MNEWMFCAMQVSLIAVATWATGRMLLNRFPEISSLIGMVGMGSAALLVVLTAAEVPRPWSLQLVAENQNEFQNVALSIASEQDISRTGTQKTSGDDVFENVAAAKPSSGITSGLQLSDIVRQVQQWTTATLPLQNTAVRCASWVATALCLLLLLRLMIGMISIIRLSCVSTVVVDERCELICSRVALRLSLPYSIEIRQHLHVLSPCVSWLAPWTIFLPDGSQNWSDDELSASLAHEMAHLKRRDAISRFLMEVFWTLLCWNPLMYLVRRQSTLAQELAADQLAARSLASQRVYTRGLLQLALRFDAGNQRPLVYAGISISSSCLIRRIRMLKGFKISSNPGAVWMQNMVGGLMLLACVWLGCWTVEAQQTQASNQQHQQEAVRVAMKESDPATGSKFFDRHDSRPWEKLGDTDGYLSVRLADLVRHPMLKYQLPILESLVERTLLRVEDGQSRRLEDFGLSFDAVQQVDMAVVSFLKDIPLDAQQKDAGKLRGGIGITGNCSRISVAADQEIDWPNLVTAIDYSMWLDQEHCAAIKTAVEKSIADGKIQPSSGWTSISIPAEGEKEPAPLTDCQKQLWNDVSGGCVTFFSRFTPVGVGGIKSVSEAAKNDPSTSVTELKFWKIAEQINALAIGLDHIEGNGVEGNGGESIRISIEPVAGKLAADLAGEMRVLRDMALVMLNSDNSISELAETTRKEWVRQLNQLRIDAIGDGSKARVLITGPISVALLMSSK